MQYYNKFSIKYKNIFCLDDKYKYKYINVSSIRSERIVRLGIRFFLNEYLLPYSEYNI